MMFEHQRRHLKYQLEIYMSRLIEVVCSESQKVTYEHKELALEVIVRYYRIPGFLTQLYLNFDCDMYTANAFEDLTKMLSKNAFPVTGLYSTHFLSLDALLTVIESIEEQCQRRIAGAKPRSDSNPGPSSDVALHKLTGKMPCSGFQVGSHLNQSTEPRATAEPSATRGAFRIPTHEEVMALKHKKKLITSATEQFNSKPTKGITFMKECGLIKAQADAAEIAQFMRKNPHLDKKQIGEYISNRKHLDVLDAFVKSFDFNGLRIDESLRLFLETFRLPGEAPLISLIVEYFAGELTLHKRASERHSRPDKSFSPSKYLRDLPILICMYTFRLLPEEQQQPVPHNGCRLHPVLRHNHAER
jgi:brefeldin A-resistance guanine nucleotide exchange factor 1